MLVPTSVRRITIKIITGKVINMALVNRAKALATNEENLIAA